VTNLIMDILPIGLRSCVGKRGGGFGSSSHMKQKFIGLSAPHAPTCKHDTNASAGRALMWINPPAPGWDNMCGKIARVRAERFSSA